MADPKVQEIEQRLQVLNGEQFELTYRPETVPAVRREMPAYWVTTVALPSGPWTGPILSGKYADVVAHAPGDLRYLLDRLAALEAELSEVPRLRAGWEVMLAMHKDLGCPWGDDPYAAIARLRRDAARLDWLDTYRGNLRQSVTGDWWVLHPEHQYSVGRGRAIRDAIDAARSSASPTEKLDELAAESQRLGLYDPQPGGPT
jgi:hypothetical protein